MNTPVKIAMPVKTRVVLFFIIPLHVGRRPTRDTRAKHMFSSAESKGSSTVPILWDKLRESNAASDMVCGTRLSRILVYDSSRSSRACRDNQDDDHERSQGHRDFSLQAIHWIPQGQ